MWQVRFGFSELMNTASGHSLSTYLSINPTIYMALDEDGGHCASVKCRWNAVTQESLYYLTHKHTGKKRPENPLVGMRGNQNKIPQVWQQRLWNS